MCAPILCGFFVEMGLLSLFQWARKLGIPWNEDTCANAAKGGQFDVLKWAKEKQRDGDWNSHICANAAKGGQLDILMWVAEYGYKMDKKTCVNAVKEGHLEVLKWARENRCMLM